MDGEQSRSGRKWREKWRGSNRFRNQSDDKSSQPVTLMSFVSSSALLRHNNVNTILNFITNENSPRRTHKKIVACQRLPFNNTAFSSFYAIRFRLYLWPSFWQTLGPDAAVQSIVLLVVRPFQWTGKCCDIVRPINNRLYRATHSGCNKKKKTISACSSWKESTIIRSNFSKPKQFYEH